MRLKDEKIFSKVEKEKTDAMEMAKEENEKREEEEKAEEDGSNLILDLDFSRYK